MINRLKNSKAGFTLIELMIVVAIVGILSAIAIPNYISYRTKGADASARSEARTFYTTSLAYFADTGDLITEFTGTNLPLGFTKNPNVTIMGGPLMLQADGSIQTAGLTFQHDDSNTLFTLGNSGAITP